MLTSVLARVRDSPKVLSWWNEDTDSAERWVRKAFRCLTLRLTFGSGGSSKYTRPHFAECVSLTL